MLGDEWHKSVGEFYTYEGSVALRDAMSAFTGGRLVIHITELPFKCPVAPLEFTFLADDYLKSRGLRERTELVFVTPLDGAFTKPVASRELGHLLKERGVTVETDFMVESIDQERKVLISYDEREVPYDQLVTIPLNMGADFVARSGLGDDLNYVPVDKHTLQSTQHPEIFALGDASNIPTSKAGSVAHFSVEVFVENFLELVAGKPMTHSFDGHANCFVESGQGKALLLDFNYDTEPLTGTFPIARIGPMTLLKESRANHLGKLAFRHIYWNLLLPGRPLGLPSQMSMTGKIPADATVSKGLDSHAQHHHRRPPDRRQRRGLPPQPERVDGGPRRRVRPSHRGRDDRGPLEARHLPPPGLQDPGRDTDPAPRQHADGDAHQAALHPLPGQARQEDVLRRRCAQAEGMRVSRGPVR